MQRFEISKSIVVAVATILVSASLSRAADINMSFVPGTSTLLHSAGADFQVKVYMSTQTGKSAGDIEINVRLDADANGVVFENPLTGVVKGGAGFNCSTPSVTQVDDENVSVSTVCDPPLSGTNLHVFTLKYAYSSQQPCPSYTEEIYGFCTVDSGADTCSVASSFWTVCNNLSCTGC